MRLFRLLFPASLIILLASRLSAQEPHQLWDFVFNDRVGGNSGLVTGSDLGPIDPGSSIRFYNIAPTSGSRINLQIEATPFLQLDPRASVPSDFDHPVTSRWDGFFPNYKSNSLGEPNGDLGFLYTIDGGTEAPGTAENYDPALNSANVNGAHLRFSFFSDDAFTTPVALPSFRILVYDVDGDSYPKETGQMESVRAYGADGFIGYQLGAVGEVLPLLVDEDGVESRTFIGRRENLPETSPEAIALLWFENTTAFTLTLETVTWGWAQNNPVFTAIDGDLSNFTGRSAGNGDVIPVEDWFAEFVPIVPVTIPEPGTYALLAMSGIAVVILRRRR